MAIGLLYDNQSLLEEYSDKIIPDKDFGDEVTRFFYKLMISCLSNMGKVSESSIAIYISRQKKATQKKFEEYGGTETLDRFKAVAIDSSGSMEKIYRNLKNYYIFRELDKVHIDVTPFLDKFQEEDPDFIIDVYEKMFEDLAVNVRGINTPNNIGEGATNYFETLEVAPDVGIDIPFPIINGTIRGLRKGSLIAIAAHTNRGKSRIISKIVNHISIKDDYRTLLVSTEMTKNEMLLQLATDIANSNFLSKSEAIEERDIAAQNITDEQKEAIGKAAEFIEENSDVDFICTNVYDYKTLERLIKRSVLQGCEYIFIDVLKPMRGEQRSGDMSEWQMYTMTAEKLKQLAIKLDISIVITMQLKTGTENDRNPSFSDLATGTHVAHVLDCLLMFRDIEYDELVNATYREVGSRQPLPLDVNKKYMSCGIAKNRAGRAGDQVVIETRKGHMEFKELGYLNRSAVNVVKGK